MATPPGAMMDTLMDDQAAEYFQREGFRNLHNLAGGIDAWSQLVDPSVPRY